MKDIPRAGSVVEPGTVRDTRIAGVSPLTTPADLLKRLPLEPEMAALGRAGALRVTYGTPSQNVRFLDALAQVL